MRKQLLVATLVILLLVLSTPFITAQSDWSRGATGYPPKVYTNQTFDNYARGENENVDNNGALILGTAFTVDNGIKSVNTYGDGTRLDNEGDKYSARFVAGISGNIDSVYFELLSHGGIHLSWNIGLQADNGSGFPTGTWLDNTLVLITSNGWIKADLPTNPVLTAGTTYYLVVENGPVNPTSANYIEIYLLTSNSDYVFPTGENNGYIGILTKDNGAAWVASTADPIFSLQYTNGAWWGQPYDDGSSLISVGGDNLAGIVTTLSTNRTLTKIFAYIRKSASAPLDSIYWVVWDNTSGVLVDNGVFATVSQVSTTLTWVSKAANISLTSGKQYLIYFKSPLNIDPTKCYYLMFTSISATGSSPPAVATFDGTNTVPLVSSNSGTTWAIGYDSSEGMMHFYYSQFYPSAYIESNIFDNSRTVDWTTAVWNGKFTATENVKIYLRSGSDNNPYTSGAYGSDTENWSGWCLEDNNIENASLPSNRYVQYRVELSRGTDNQVTPTFQNITISSTPDLITPPNKPTNLNPSTRQTSTSVSISAVDTDNNGDTINVFFYDNSTKTLVDNIWISSGGTAQVTWSGLTRGTTYTFFARGKDINGNWSENSATQSFAINRLPLAENLVINSLDAPTHLTTFTPLFVWQNSDQDNDPIENYRFQVGTSLGDNSMWDNSGGTVPGWLTYAGATLSRGVTYFVRVKVYDGYEWSGWDNDNFRINRLPLAENLKIGGLDAPTHLVTFTPALTWQYSDQDGDTIDNYQLRVGISLGDNSKWDSKGTIISGITYAGTILSRGTTYYVSFRVRDGYEWGGSWENDNFRINQLPICSITAPAGGLTVGIGEGISFTSSASDPDGDGITYLWNFGDNSTSTLANPSYSYPVSGGFIVTLKVNDGYENSTEDTVAINVTGGAPPTPGGPGGPGGPTIPPIIQQFENQVLIPVVGATNILLVTAFEVAGTPIAVWIVFLAIGILAWLLDQRNSLRAILVLAVFLAFFGQRLI